MSDVGDKSQSWLRYALVMIVALAALAFLGFMFAVYVPVTANYSVQATFESMPEDDVELLRWVARQPGFTSVIVERTQGGESLKIRYRMTSPILGRPEPPAWRQAFAELGYTLTAASSP